MAYVLQGAESAAKGEDPFSLKGLNTKAPY
jgi:hypothetical protein